MVEFTTEAIKILYPKFQNLLSNASNELYRYSAEIYPNDYYANLALKHLRDTYFQPYLTGLTFLLCRYEPCKPLTRQRAINDYLAKPVMPDYKDTPEFKNWLKAERAKKETKRQASIKEEERDDRQLKSEQQKTQQLTNYETKQGQELARQRRQLEFTKQREQQDQRLSQIETRLGNMKHLETQLLALKSDVETRDRQALEYFGNQIEEGRLANVRELTQAMEKYTGTYQQLALQCDNLTQQTRQAIEYQTKAIENARETLALEYEQKTEQRISILAIQFEKQQTEQMKALALGYDKERIEAEQKIKAELNAQIQAVSQSNQLTYDNQQKAIDQLRARYEQEFRDRLQAITNAQDEARASIMGTTRAIISAQASQIREQQQQALTEQTKQLHDELNKQQIQALEFQKEVQELKANTERRIDVLGRAPVQEIKTSEYLAELAKLRELITHQGRVLETMREQNTQGENKVKEYQQMADLWARELGISDAQCLADIKARIEELFVIGTKPDQIQQYLKEFQQKFQHLLSHHDEVMAYVKASQATQKTMDNIKQRSATPALTFDIHIGYVKNYFGEQLAIIYEPSTELYRELCQWGDTEIENMAQRGISITIIGGKVRDIPRRFEYFLEVIGEPFHRDAWARAWSNEKMGVLPQKVKPKPELPVLGDDVIDITNRPDTTPDEVLQLKKDFAEYVKAHNVQNEQDYIDAIDLYIDMLWHNLHKIEVIFIAIKHLKAKIDENLTTLQSFKPAFNKASAEVFREIEELGGIVEAFEHWANHDLFPDFGRQFRFPAEYLAQTIQRIGTLYEMGIAPSIIGRIIEHFKTQIRQNTNSKGLDEAFKQASQEITEQAMTNINSFDDKTEQAQRIEDEAQELAQREAEWQQWKAWNDKERKREVEEQERAQKQEAEEEQRKRAESDKIWAMNAEATQQFLQAQSNKITQRQDFINLYAKNLFEIGKNTPLGDVWNEDDAMSTAKREIDELRAQGWDGEPIDFTVFPTFRALAEESQEYHTLISFYGKTQEQAMDILRARRDAIEQETIEAYEKQQREERAREYWEDGLPKAIVENPGDREISILLAHTLRWCYFISRYRQTVNGTVIECDKFTPDADGYNEHDGEPRLLDAVGYPIDVSLFSDVEMETYASAMNWMAISGLVRRDALVILEQAGKYKDEWVATKNSVLLATSFIYADQLGQYHSMIMEWLEVANITLPEDLFRVFTELPPEIKAQYDNYEKWQEWRAQAHIRHDFYENQQTQRLSYKYIDFRGLDPEILKNEIERLAYILCIIRPHDIDIPTGQYGQMGSGPILDGFCWFLLEDRDEYYRQDWVDALWWQWTYLNAHNEIPYMNGEHPPLPKPIYEAPFEFYVRRDRIDQDPIMKPVWANYVAELKAGKWLNILTDDSTHNQVLLQRCPLPDDMMRSLGEDAEINAIRIQKEAEENEERKRRNQRMKPTKTKPRINKFAGVGIQPNGVYCYANALFQVLAHIPDFGITDLPISCQLGELIRAILTHESPVPIGFVHSILITLTQYYPALRWKLGEQQDPHELFLLLANKVYPSMGRLFTLTIDHFARGEEVLRPETFFSLPIDAKAGIPSAFRAEQKGDYGMVELRILEAPAVFMFQVKRFRQGTDQKDSTPIQLPEEINFDRYMVLSMPSNYRLYATINHTGEYRTGGHYVAMINVNMSSFWFLFDDAKVSKVATKAKFDNLRSNAYLAFYVHTDLIASLFNQAVQTES